MKVNKVNTGMSLEDRIFYNIGSDGKEDTIIIPAPDYDGANVNAMLEGTVIQGLGNAMEVYKMRKAEENAQFLNYLTGLIKDREISSDEMNIVTAMAYGKFFEDFCTELEGIDLGEILVSEGVNVLPGEEGVTFLQPEIRLVAPASAEEEIDLEIMNNHPHNRRLYRIGDAMNGKMGVKISPELLQSELERLRGGLPFMTNIWTNDGKYSSVIDRAIKRSVNPADKDLFHADNSIRLKVWGLLGDVARSVTVQNVKEEMGL